MGLFIAIGIILLIVSVIVVLWVRGIDYMHQNHPDYKGEDFLNWGNDVHQKAAAGRDGWDEQDDWYPHETL
jgi:hypothetical protein